jgi:hypothetical protein
MPCSRNQDYSEPLWSTDCELTDEDDCGAEQRAFVTQ